MTTQQIIHRVNRDVNTPQIRILSVWVESGSFCEKYMKDDLPCEVLKTLIIHKVSDQLMGPLLIHKRTANKSVHLDQMDDL